MTCMEAHVSNAFFPLWHTRLARVVSFSTYEEKAPTTKESGMIMNILRSQPLDNKVIPTLVMSRTEIEI